MSNPIRILSNNYIQTTESGISETNTGTVLQTPADIKEFVPDNVLLDLNLRGNTSLSSSSSENCRNYSGLQGLRQLKTDQKDFSGGQPKCGWMYKSSGGINPLVSRGAFGSVAGPIHGEPGGRDDVSNGVRWYNNLNQAELDISTELCGSIRSCNELANLGAQSSYVGYCKSTGAIIPITQNSRGAVQARYKKNGMGCQKKDIITSRNLNKCPTEEGFQASSRRMPSQSLHSTNVRPSQEAEPPIQEGFFSEDDADDDDGEEGDLCDSLPLSRKCVIQAAQFAGCSDKGSLILSLQQGDATGRQGYNSVLRAKPSFQAYQQLTNPRLNDAMLRDGSVTLQTAIDSFSYVPQMTSSNNTKLRLAAADLCVNEGAFEEYDFCSDIDGGTIVTSSHLECLKKFWKKAGGTEKGTLYNDDFFRQFYGNPYFHFILFVTIGRIPMFLKLPYTYENQQNQKNKNEYLKQVLGIHQKLELTRLPINTPSIRGIECIWEAYFTTPITDYIVLGQEIRYANSGRSLYPHVRDGNELKRLIGITRMAGVTILQEQRTTERGFAVAHVQTDGQTDMAHTINGFAHESRSNMRKLLDSKSRTLLSSEQYVVEANDTASTFLISQLFSYYPPSPSFLFNNVDTTAGANLSRFAHLTQEANAPWLRLEVCDRVDNGNRRKTTLQDTRMRTTIFDVKNTNTNPIINSESRQELPGGKCYIRFVPNSSWKTVARFAYTGLRTITMLFRPTTTMNSNEESHLFSHAYRPDANTRGGFYIHLIHGNRLKINAWDKDNRYYSWTTPYYVNEWNFLVIQYVKQSDTSEGMLNDVFGVTTNCYRYSRLRQSSDTRMDVINELRLFRENNRSARSAFYPIPKDGMPRDSWAGQLCLGMIDHSSLPSFSGDIGWIHGYRTVFQDVSMLEKEINQTWKTSWYEANLP